MKHIVMVAALVLLPTALACQTARRERTNRVLREKCERAAESVRKGPQDPDYERVMWKIAGCDDTGPEALSARWQQISGADRKDLETMVRSTQELRDARLLASMIATATDASRPVVVRMASIQVLFNYLNPSYEVPLDVLLNADKGCSRARKPQDPATPACWTIPLMSHPTSTREGAQPMPANSALIIRRTFQTLAEGDADAKVRGAAKLLIDETKYR